MRIKKKQRPKPWQWQLESLGHSLLETVVCRLPAAWVFRLGEMLGGLVWYLVPMRRKIVLRNLRIAFAGEKDLPELRRMAKETFRRSSANLISAAHTARLSPEKLRGLLEVENLHLLEQAQAEGKGVVLLLAHMGNWELLTKLVHFFPKGSKCGAFYRPLNNPLLDDRIRRRRQIDGTRMFSKRDPFHQVTGFLREGGIVGVLADQRVGIQGEVTPFFGRFTRTSPLPSLLARRAKAEVLTLALVTERPGKWKAVFMPVKTPYTTPHCMAALEKVMMFGPTDVFWLQDRWKVFVKRLRPFSNWLEPADEKGRKPHRALIWLTEAMDSWGLPEAWFHPDISYEVTIPASGRAPKWAMEEARLHHLPVLHAARDIRRVIRILDAGDPLPFDFIITRKAPKALAQAAFAEQILLVQTV
jgi:KDO2-lipid IV(A) lauroyltransferase